MKKSLIISALIMFCVFDASSITLPPSFGNYRWRNDDGNETAASWKAAENDSIFQQGEGNIRLRMEILTNGQNLTKSTGLYYKVTGDTVDTLMHLVSDDDANAFTFSLSPNIIDGEPTTQQLTITGGQTNAAGFIKENPGFFNFSITDGERKELEFCIKASPNADYNNKMYNFLLAGEDSVGFFYVSNPEFDSLLPSIILQKTTLTITADNKSKFFGHENPELTVSYSGFVDGDDESVIDTLPKIITTANTSSPVGNYDIVPYGASDNKYSFNFVNGTLGVKAPNAISETENEVLLVYPNPANNFLYLKGKIPAGAMARVFDLTGRAVLEQQLSSQVIDISPLSNGNYILKINDLVFKITKE
jgi:hypothetical protein